MENREISEESSDGPLTEDTMVKGRSTVADIASFLQTMRSSDEESPVGRKQSIEVNGQPSTDGDELHASTRARYHWHRAITKVLATVRLTNVIRSREFQPKDFEKIGLIGEGSMGSVYLVRMKGTEKLYAMKVLRKRDFPTKRAVRRVIAEREVLLMCNHPFITDMYFAFQTERHLYLVLEYCSGGDLSNLVERLGRPLQEEELRFYMCEIILALEYLHASGFIYRDLKPQNVLIHRSGHLRLADFSIATTGEVDTYTPDKQKKKPKRSKLYPKTRRTTTQSCPGSPLVNHKFIEGWNVSNDRPHEKYTPFRVTVERRLSEPRSAPVSERLSENNSRPESERSIEVPNSPSASDVLSEPDESVPDHSEQPQESMKPRRRSWLQRLLKPFTNHPENGPNAASTPTKQSSDLSMLERFKARLGRSPLPSHRQGRASFGVDVKHNSNSLVGTVEYMAPEVILGHDQGTEVDWWALGVLAYELLLLETPFAAPSRREVFVNILQNDPAFYHPMRNLSDDCTSLLRGLLEKIPEQRLGHGGNVSEIKQHRFFKDVHWALIANEKPPFEPQEHGPLFSIGDFSYSSSHSKNEEELSSVPGHIRSSTPNEQEDLERTVKKSRATIENRRSSLFEDVFQGVTDAATQHPEEPACPSPEIEDQNDSSFLPDQRPEPVFRRSLSENLHTTRDPFDLFDSPR